jgi:hypothetical protein
MSFRQVLTLQQSFLNRNEAAPLIRRRLLSDASRWFGFNESR